MRICLHLHRVRDSAPPAMPRMKFASSAPHRGTRPLPLPYASFPLAVAALRDQDRAQANILAGPARKFAEHRPYTKRTG